MKIEQAFDCRDKTGRVRHRVWCLSEELTAGTGDDAGTYTINDTEAAAGLGFGSEIVVIDLPGKLLFWDDVRSVAYDWTAAT